jgi:hypothetical protein
MAALTRPRVGVKVFLNVYDLSPANDWTHPIGMGAYHSGVEVYGAEWSFGSGGGVFSCTPREAGGAKFREQVLLGEVRLSERGAWVCVAPRRAAAVHTPHRRCLSAPGATVRR